MKLRQPLWSAKPLLSNVAALNQSQQARGKIIVLLIIKRQLIQQEATLDMNPVTTMHNTEIKPSSSFAFLQTIL